MKTLMYVPFQNGALSIQQESLVIILSSGAQTLLEVISVRAITWISLYTTRSKAIIRISVLINAVAIGTAPVPKLLFSMGTAIYCAYVLPKIQS